ncbi:S8 family serine peptidase [Gallaecimonas kandeliae]|uniref:S8 family serine peptidase n=1 Tax=Gallaecimonas kandeliae TaxID=3029055 RepID=UPI0026483346|nr:S8 family serine peptidase [Gallaecimonas kandeliae]WKE65851.1 S8 family serine peptidase [Gallaecimonas kandeliae]
MKLKSLTLATLSALYSAGVATTVLAAPSMATGAAPVAKLQEMKLPSAEFMAQQQLRNKTSGNAVKRNNGQNIQLKRNTIADKFKASKADAQGEHDYIVELYGDTVIEQQRAMLVQQVASGAIPAKTLNDASAMRVTGAALRSPTAASQQLKVTQGQDSVLSAASALIGRQLDPKLRYTKVLNGFSLKMTQAEAQRMASLPQVKRITKNQMYHLQTDYGPIHIGADKVWSGDNVTNTPYQGEGMVVGIVDTGINTDHPSFQPTGDDGYTVQNPLGHGNYLGDCTQAEFADRCNDKLIGVFSYERITDAYSADAFQDPSKPWYEPNVEIRPRFGEDYVGHGSHTASTVAGNVIKNAPFQAASPTATGHGIDTGFTFDRVSGMAPHANIVAFQVCFPGESGDPYAGCPGDAILAGIEDAVATGVDVINFSIGGQESSPWESPMEQAFLQAHEAGIAVAVAAGNSGQNASGNEVFGYIDHSSPWLVNVAAASDGRNIGVVGKSLTNFDSDSTMYVPTTISGGSLSGGIVGDVVYAKNYPDPDTSDAFGPETCNVPFPAGTFQPTDIVVCDRGDIARKAKADNVKAGGAGGFVLANMSYDTSSPDGMIFNDIYSLPGIQISAGDAYYLKNWLADGSYHKGEITASHVERTIDENQADILASFSSRGPSYYAPEHLIPMITAPGVNIYAANSDDQPFTMGPNASDWTIMSGTSMASPHVAGAMTLVRQAHPDWTVSEVQSAMQMTSVQDVRYLPNPWSPLQDADIYRAGSGRVDVNAAVNSGLLMDESVENFRNADPANGGVVHNLNLPELVNMHCAESCTWVRTFKATRDGSWTVEPKTGEFSFQLEATPSSFSLKAGQTQSVVFTAKILNSQAKNYNSESEVHGSVRLVPDQPDIPSVFMPVAVTFDNRNLPDSVGFTSNRDQGIHNLGNLMLPQADAPVYSAATPVKAQLREVTLPQSVNYCSFACSHVPDASTDVTTIDVPEGASRLMVEVLARTATTIKGAANMWMAGDADVFIGYDANGDGQPDWDSEAICMSTSEGITDYCNINNPQPGKYWVVISNYQHNFIDPANTFDTYKVASAVVGKDGSNALTAEGPAMLDGLTPADVKLNWDLPDAVKGDVYYSMLTVGSDASQPANIAQIPVRIERGNNDVTLEGSQTQARAGDVIDMHLHVMENLDGYDHDINISSTLPGNLALVPGSVKLSKAINAEGLEETDNGFTLTSNQPNSADWQRGYKVTTSDNDPLCHMPNYGQADRNYVNLWDFGFRPQIGGEWNDNTVVPLSWYYGDGAYATVFHNFDQTARFPNLTISPMGYLQLDEMPLFYPEALPADYQGFPDAFIAPFMRGIAVTESGIDWSQLHTPLNVDLFSEANTSGISMGFTADGTVIMEWDKARTYMQEASGGIGIGIGSVGASPQSSGWVDVDRDDSYDFETVYNLNYRYGDGQYEVIMGYQNIDFGTQGGQGSIGIHGFEGYRGSFGPEGDYLGSQYALDNLKDKVKSDLAVCYDYVGPESSQFDIDFQVMVKNDASGTEEPIKVNVDRSGLPTETLEHNLNVPSNITVGAIGDQTIAEDTQLDGLMVAYSDENQVANIITVSGDHVTGVANGNTPGSTVTIVPEANFNGTTTVTITVADSKNPSDAASTSFALNVTPVADAPLANAGSTVTITEGDSATLDGSASVDPDGGVLSYSWTGSDGSISNGDQAVASVSGLSAGDHSFTLTVSNANGSSSANMTVHVNGKSGGGGAGGLLLLLAAPLAWLRRRKAA